MGPQETSRAHKPIRTFGRRLGRPLKPTRKAALDKLATLAVPADFITQDGTKDPRALFAAPVDKVWFEIGFGSGEHLLARLAQSPTDGFIGAEPYINGMSAFLGALPADHAPRVRVHMDDALTVLSSMADKSLDGLYILNPDPWPKKRHLKRRIVNPDNMALFTRVLKNGAQLVISTDVSELYTWMTETIAAHPDFTIDPAFAADPHTPPKDWPLTTRYMAWGVSEGRRPHFAIYYKK